MKPDCGLPACLGLLAATLLKIHNRGYARELDLSGGEDFLLIPVGTIYETTLAEKLGANFN